MDAGLERTFCRTREPARVLEMLAWFLASQKAAGLLSRLCTEPRGRGGTAALRGGPACGAAAVTLSCRCGRCPGGPGSRSMRPCVSPLIRPSIVAGAGVRAGSGGLGCLARGRLVAGSRAAFIASAMKRAVLSRRPAAAGHEQFAESGRAADLRARVCVMRDRTPRWLVRKPDSPFLKIYHIF